MSQASGTTKIAVGIKMEDAVRKPNIIVSSSNNNLQYRMNARSWRSGKKELYRAGQGRATTEWLDS
jgi:hypothetical protein